jgi:hypothetical protein
MRKTTFARPFSCPLNLLRLVALGLACLPAFAQDTGSAAVPAKDAPAPAAAMPTDPKALMLLAVKTNGLTGPEVQPWHLKATWKSFDEQGNVKDQGTYEEYWISGTKSKSTFTGTTFVETLYFTEKGILRTVKNSNPRPWQLSQLREAIVGPWRPRVPIANCVEYARPQFSCSNPINYMDRSIPGDIEEGLDGKIVLTAHVESIEPVTASDEMEF